MPKLSRSNPKAAPTHAPENMPRKQPSRSRKSSPKKKKMHGTTPHSQSAKAEKIAGTPNARGKQLVPSPATRRSSRGKNSMALEDGNVELLLPARKPRAARPTHQTLSAIEEESLNTLPAATKEVSSVPSLLKSPPESKASADQNLSPNENETINTVAANTTEVSSVPCFRKSARKINPPRYDLIGTGDRIDVRTDAIESPGIAAAASTLIYQLQHGKDNANKSKYEYESESEYGKDKSVNESKYENDSESAVDECDDSGGSDLLECNESETSEHVPHGLEYSDNKDILIDLDSDEEALRSSFPRDKSRKNMVPGGPEQPDISMCTESKGKVLLQRYAKARKAYTNKQ